METLPATSPTAPAQQLRERLDHRLVGDVG